VERGFVVIYLIISYLLNHNFQNPLSGEAEERVGQRSIAGLSCSRHAKYVVVPSLGA
jgi:hypothetical protein